MLAWFAANLGTIVVSLILLAVVAAILRSAVRDRKRGKSSCGGSCGSCSGCAGCRPGRGA